jgi:DNA-binding MarR family transcriptional regulator
VSVVQTTTRQTTTRLPSQLRLAVMRLARRLRQEKVGDLTASQLSAMASIERRGPISLGELAEIERIAPPSMTRIATRLEEMALVVRTVDTADRRIARLTLSDQGRSLHNQTRNRRDAYLARRLQAFTPEEREILLLAAPLLERLTRDEE